MGIDELEYYWKEEKCSSVTDSNFAVLSKGLNNNSGFSSVGFFDRDIAESESILEIGPGRGTCIKEINSKYPEKQLSIADISQIQLDRIVLSGLTKYKFYELPSNVSDMIYFHLVLQHIPKHLTKDFFTIIYKALKPKGKIYFQYLVAIDESKIGQIWQSGTILHSDSELLKILTDIGFIPMKIVKIPVDEQYWWAYFYIIK